MAHHGRLEKGDLGERHMNVERLELMAQGLRVSFEGELASRVGTQERNGCETGQRAGIDDSSLLLPAHGWQNRLHHPHDAEEVGLELRPDLIQREFFRRTCQLVTGVVDENVDSAGVAQHRAHTRGCRVIVAHVESHHLDGGYGLRPRWFTARTEDLVTASRKQPGRRLADSGRCARDYGYSLLRHSPPPTGSITRRNCSDRSGR